MARPQIWDNFTAFCEVYKKTLLVESIIKEETTIFPFLKFLYPIALVTFLTAFFQLLLKPLGQVAFVSQILAGIALGPSFLERNEKFSKKMFSPKVIAVLNVFDAFGLLYMLFLLSVRVDISIVKKAGRLAIVIGIGSFVVPFMASTLTAFLIKDSIQLDDELRHTLPAVAGLECTMNFHVILVLLTDLNLLNSDLGRIALSSSLISGALGWFVFSIGSNARDASQRSSNHATLFVNLSIMFMTFLTIFALRPAMFWMMKQTPEGKPLRHSYVLAINIMFLCCCLFSEATGFHGFFGAIILGISTPNAPPLGSRLVDRIEYVVWAVFMPCFIINTGRRVNLFAIKRNAFVTVASVIFVSNFIKLLCIIIPSLYYKMAFADAFSLGLVLTSRGIYDVQILSHANRRQIITDESLTIMVMTAIIYTAIAVPLVRFFYDSSRRYIAYGKHSIQQCGRHAELRIIACILEPDNVSTIINFLQASNPHRSSLGIYVMNLEQYIGSSMPQLIHHKGRTNARDFQHRSNKMPTGTTKIDYAINAFRHFEQQNRGLISVQCYTTIAPYASMHDDICSMAFDKSTSLVIIPFQKTNSPLMKLVLKNVLKVAPCSVGILFDRGLFLDSRPIFKRRLIINVCVIFVGGPDDREALAYGARMAENTSIMLTVIRFIGMKDHSINDHLMEEKLDSNMISELRRGNTDNNNVKYINRSVKEGSDTAYMLNAIGDDFDLILAGRRHDNGSQVLMGLSEWNEIEDLGVIGDILVSSEFQSKTSVMVIQQQASFVESTEATRFSFRIW